ncbi:CYTH and CHAD domain-containing protein [Nonomuraea pusilla]|uniref:CYTH and CHAD domain-containing protein n=1 Tax=Nonomuraea pusilla TaxID=46177 RepID=UPI003332C9DE
MRGAVGIEIEDKFDVPPDYAIPDLTRLGEVVGPKSHQLVALYYDTPDLRLAARGVTLRRRRGGADPGWHLKLPKARGARQEITRPLTRSTKEVPQDLAELVRAYTRGAPLVVVAELETRRSVTLLREGGAVLVEVADDRVKGTAFCAEGKEEGKVVRWREVEAELLDHGRPELLAKVGKRLRKAGAVPAGTGSKLARLLRPAPPTKAATEPGSAGEVVVDYLASQVTALLAQDPRVRRAEEDAVHRMRVAARRLRSALKAFRGVVTGTEPLQEELRRLGAVLGEARDLEVIRERFGRRLDALPPELVTGPVRARLGSDLREREKEAYGRIRDVLSGDRYYALLDALDAVVARPELGKAAAKPAGKKLDAVALAAWKKVTKAYETAQSTTDPEGREIALHDVRKAAKRARYTAEALEPVLGGRMAKLAELAKGVQEALGGHQDGVVAQETLAKEAERARRAGEDTFTYGVLAGLERAAAERAHADVPRVWEETVEAAKKLA